MDDSYMSPEAIFLEQQRQVTALRAEVERLKACGIEGMQHRIAELEAALKRCKDAATDLRSGGFNEWEIADEIEDAAAALKGPDA